MAYSRWMYSDELFHHGVKGQKWGERNGPPYPLNSSISDGHKLIKSDGSPQSKKKYKTSEKTAHKRATRKVRTVFVSGSSKTQDEASGYYRKELPKDIQKQLDNHMRKGNRIIVGDAPGIDRQVQDYLNAKKYKNVEIYGPGKQVRYSANSKWKTNPIDDPDHEPGSKEWLAKKDIAMTEAADEGLAVVLDEGAKATRKNVQRLSDSGKSVKVYSLNQNGNDSWENDWDRKWNTSYASKDVKKANDIYKTLSKQEKYFLTAEENSKRYVSREEYGKKGTNVYSVIEQYKDTPVSVIDIWKNDRGGADVSIAVRNDERFRHKGYASRALENGVKYFYDHPELEYLIWGVNSQNRPSIELAKKYGFYLYDKRDDGWETYTLDQKKEVKHTMSYNRWLAPDELMHHGVPRQEWGKRNGPPYPLYRQERFRTIGPDGKPITSKVAYKKAQKNVRAANRAERKANPNGTPQDKKERNSFGAQIKRKYRQYKRDQKAKEAERERKEAEAEERRKRGEEAWDEAAKRFNESDISSEERKKILQGIERSRMGGYKDDGYDEFVHPTWGARINRGIEAEILNKAIDKHEADKKAARDAAKEHGTAEEVMKYRDTFNKDEWNEIAGRLEAEARVKKLLDRPLDSANSNQNQGKNQSQGQPQEKTSSSGLSGKLKKIAEKGDAREVYQNRAKFTPEQLKTISRRLEAEETIGKFADNQLLFKSDTLRNLENVARYAQTAGKIATGISTITKAFGGSGGGGNNNQSNNGGGGNNQQNSGKKKDENNKLNERLTRLEESMRSKGLRYTGGNIVANAHLVERLNAQKSNKKEKQKK